MGYLVYDSSTRVSFDDELLAQLQAVIVTKLRRKESFTMSWKEPEERGGGRTAIWLSEALPLRFNYEMDEVPHHDQSWIERLAKSAAGSTGLVVTDQVGQIAIGETVERNA